MQKRLGAEIPHNNIRYIESDAGQRFAEWDMTRCFALCRAVDCLSVVEVAIENREIGRAHV